MSKTDKPIKTSPASQLKKELNQAGKVIQSLTSSLESLEKSFCDAETALSNERALKEQLSSAQRNVVELREACSKAKSEHQGDIDSFANSTQKLIRTYDERLKQLQRDCDLELAEFKRREEAIESGWKRKITSQEVEINRLKTAESHFRNDVGNKLREEKETWEKQEKKLHLDLQQQLIQVGKLRQQNENLLNELHDQNTIQKGRDKEMQRLASRLATLEAFLPEDVQGKVSDILGELQIRLREFCKWTLDSADTLPGWNTFPERIRYEHLPRMYSAASESGRYVFVAAIQHSICTAMKQSFFPPFGTYSDGGIWDVSDALFQNNQSHEAVWRLMTANTILSNPRIAEKYEAKLRKVANSLVSLWSPFPGDEQKKETLDRLTRLLIDSAMKSLELLKLRSRIHVSFDATTQHFESDSEEDLHNVPGGFQLPDSTAAVLCLFPAFFWDASPAGALQPALLRKGTAMFRDSPPLLAALNEVQEVRSPTMGSKRRPTN